jgi:hypothetical protein
LYGIRFIITTKTTKYAVVFYDCLIKKRSDEKNYCTY